MKDKEFVIEQNLCDIYYDPGYWVPIRRTTLQKSQR